MEAGRAVVAVRGVVKALMMSLVLLALPAAAQDVGQTGHAVLQGTAVDSLRGGMLRGAILRVTGTARMGITDSVGRFRIDSLPAGTHSVELFHEVLDTLGVRVRTEPLVFAADSVVSLTLGIPSGLTIVRARCGTSAADQGAITGMVFSADTHDALAGVNVRLLWTQISVGREFGIREEPHQYVVLTDADGRYKFCGLPNELAADIYADGSDGRTVRIPVRYEAAMLTVVNLYMPTSRSRVGAGAPGEAAPSGAPLRGVVMDSGGAPLAGARVAVGSGVDAAVTDAAGSFALNGLEYGTQTLVVRRLGYLPAEVVVHLTRDAPREVVVQLGRYVPVLEEVLIEARRDFGLQLVGFTSRERTGLGRYLSPTDLARRSAYNVSDYLRHLPPPRAGALGRACTTYWVDGMRFPGNADDFLSPNEVAAIEVYSRVYAPPEFTSGFDNCRVVVIWTKWKLGVR